MKMLSTLSTVQKYTTILFVPVPLMRIKICTKNAARFLKALGII